MVPPWTNHAPWPSAPSPGWPASRSGPCTTTTRSGCCARRVAPRPATAGTRTPTSSACSASSSTGSSSSGSTTSRAALADPAADTLVHLRRQHALLGARIERLRRLSDAVALAMEAHQMDIPLTPEERLEVFGPFDPDEHAAEAQERWGDTDAYRESARRTARYTKADWLRIKAEGEAATRAVADAMAGGPARRLGRGDGRRRGAPPPDRRLRSTRARTRCTRASPRCTSRTRGSRRPTRRSRPGSRSTCTTRSWPTPRATPADAADADAHHGVMSNDAASAPPPFVPDGFVPPAGLDHPRSGSGPSVRSTTRRTTRRGPRASSTSARRRASPDGTGRTR